MNDNLLSNITPMNLYSLTTGMANHLISVWVMDVIGWVVDEDYNNAYRRLWFGKTKSIFIIPFMYFI